MYLQKVELAMEDMFDNHVTMMDAPQTLPLLTENDKHVLLEEFNNTKVDYAGNQTVIDLFESRVAFTPDAIAVAFEERQFTYKEINAHANQLAHYLRSKGVKEETLVPICIERSPQMIIGVLGILKAGGAYVPVDPEYPAERIQFMLQDTQPVIAVSSTAHKSKLQYSKALNIVELDAASSPVYQHPSSNGTAALSNRRLAYIIYTSGSTGKPKGVMIEHRGLVNLALTQAQAFGLKPGMRTLQFASFGFDASCSEIFTALLSGGCLVLPKKEELLSAEAFEKLVTKHQVQVVTLPPSYQQVVKNNLGTIKTIISAGEPLNETTGSYLQSKGIRLINAYGPTENTVCVSMSDDPVKDNHVVVIGKPIANVQVYILDKEGNICPIGVAGEICVSGIQVARGYLNRPDLTAEKFVANPFSGEAGARMYKTGDLGRWHADGNIEFLGRQDDQVKIRGYRIELGEIEHVLHQCSLVSQAVVIAKEDKEKGKRLVAYIVPNGFFDRRGIISFLKEKLPEYMTPSILVKMKSFQLTSSGKIDKKALPEPDMGELFANEYVAPRTEIEQQLANIWQKLFDIEQIGVHDNFFDLGGTSIMAIQVVTQAKRAGYNLQPSDFFNYQNIEDLSKVINKRLRAEQAKAQAAVADSNNQEHSIGNEKSIVTINNKGTKVPFFFLAPGFTVFDRVTYYLDKDQPMYFFIPVPYNSVEEIAAYYIVEMKKIQPLGPYCISAYCDFGEVGLEMAQQLTAKGEKVTFLALFDFYHPTAIKPINDPFNYYKERLMYYYKGLKSSSLKQKAVVLYQLINRKLRKAKKKTFKVVDRKLKNIPQIKGYLIARNLYTAKPYNGKVLLFRSTFRAAIRSDDPYMGWHSYFTGKVELYTIDGNHKTMFKEPGAIQIAEKLKTNAAV